jgi:HDOD domain-containing protein
MRGFRDNLHLYDRLVPFLSPPRRIIAFDFLGWCASAKPQGYPFTAANQLGELDSTLSSKVLSLSNSARIGWKPHIDSVDEALIVLGEKMFLRLVVSASSELFPTDSEHGYSL